MAIFVDAVDRPFERDANSKSMMLVRMAFGRGDNISIIHKLFCGLPHVLVVVEIEYAPICREKIVLATRAVLEHRW